MNEKRDLNSLFSVRGADRAFKRVVPRRVEYVRPFKDIPLESVEWMKEQAYQHAGLEEYLPCWTGEMASRPIPFVSTDPKPLRTKEVFERYIRDVFAFLLPDMTPAIQTINKISALGYPVNGNPGDGVDHKAGSRTEGLKIKQSKFDVAMELFALMEQGDFDLYKDGYHTIGCRKQNEPPSKKREFQFITSSGQITQRDITAESRIIEVPGLGPMVGSRTRTIVRPPVVNLWLQCFDTLMHNAIKKHPLCEANVYTNQEWPSDSNFVSFDCKHYERYLGLCAIAYANAVGGRYEEQLLQLIYYPFVVPSDDWARFFELKPLFGPGVYPQFSSGLSPVAPLGKLANICVQVAFFVERKGLDVRSAIATTLSGTFGSMRRWSFGDDNRVLGPQGEIDEFCEHMSQYFEIEQDDTPAYLGTIFRRDYGRWFLPAKTYNLKLYQPERDFEFKDYPNLGMVSRRATFTEFGEPEIARDIIPFEDDLWNAIDHPYVKIVAAAIAERNSAMMKGVKLNEYLVTDKDYLMTEEEKVRSGMFWHLKPDVVASIVLSLVGPEVRALLPFKDMRHVPLPTPPSSLEPFSQAGIPNTEDEEEEETNSI
jgi:hypothetical protein